MTTRNPHIAEPLRSIVSEVSADKIRLTHSQMNVMLIAVEYGYKQREKGKSLTDALASVFELYEVTP